MAFENLDLREVYCFGFSPSKDGETTAWQKIAEETTVKGWNDQARAKIEFDLARNVDTSYEFVCQGRFVDVDSDMEYKALFVNDHMLWRMEIPGSPDAEIIPEEAAEFFKAPYFLKFAKRCGDWIDKALKTYAKVVESKLKTGEFIEVDPVRLDRILVDSAKKYFMSNLRLGKYELV